MPRSVLPFALAFGLLAGTTLGSPATAANRPAADTSRGQVSWTFLPRVFPVGLEKIGCSFDPNGGCIQKQPPGNKNGCTFDPDGRCIQKQPPGNKNGCTFDPNGACLQKQPPGTKAGCKFDPDGRCIPIQ